MWREFDINQRFLKNVAICPTNQDILEKSDFIFLAVRPQEAESILQSLIFRPDHTLLSLLPNISLDEIKQWNKSVKTLTKIVLTTFVTEYKGPVAFFPPHPHLDELFGKLGMKTMNQVNCEKHLEIMRAQTALTVSFFVLFRNFIAWADKHGLPEESEMHFLSEYLRGVSSKMKSLTLNDFKALSEEMRPSGMNAKLLSLIGEDDGFSPWVDGLEKILSSIHSSSQDNAG